MTRHALLVVALSGCGRLGFTGSEPDDAPSVTGDVAPDITIPVGHDEDGDGTPDGDDNCPAVANASQANGDTDPIGDACDPEPALARQSLALFTPFIGPDPRLTAFGSACAFGADEWICDGTGNRGVMMDLAYTDIDVWAALDIVEVQTASPQIAVYLGAPLPEFYAEIYDSPALTPSLNITRNDGTFTTLSTTSVTDPIPTGLVTFHVAGRASAGTITVDVNLAGSPFMVFGGDSQLGPGTHVAVNAFDVSVRLRSLMVVLTTP